MKMKKNNEPLKVVIGTKEFSFAGFIWSMDKEYVKEPTKTTNEPFQNLVPFEFDKDGE